MKPLFAPLAIWIALAGTSIHAGEPSSGKEFAPLALPVECEDCLSYDFVDLEYGLNDFGTPFQSDGDFHQVGFSKSLGSKLFLTGAFADGTYNLETRTKVIDGDTRRYRLGLGTHRKIADCVDLTFEGGAEHLDAEYMACGCMDYDSWGYYFGPGIRARSGRFEVFAKAFFTGREGDNSQLYLSYLTPAALGVDEDGWVFSLGAVYHLTDHLGLKAALEAGELDTAFTLGMRFEF